MQTYPSARRGDLPPTGLTIGALKIRAAGDFATSSRRTGVFDQVLIETRRKISGLTTPAPLQPIGVGSVRTASGAVAQSGSLHHDTGNPMDVSGETVVPVGNLVI